MMEDESLTRPFIQRPFISSSMPSFPTFTSPSSSFSNGFSPNNPKYPPSSSSSPSSSFSSRRSLPKSSSSSSWSSYPHNLRIAIALVPSALFLVDLGGSAVVATLTITLMLSYILDSLRLKSASFFAVWFSILSSQFSFFFSSPLLSSFPSLPLSLLSLSLSSLTSFLIGVWSSLQFRFLLLENPSIPPALERLLFAVLPVSSPALFSWAVVYALGLSPSSSYFFASFNCLFFWLFSLPRPSSFLRSKPDTNYDHGHGILSPLESCVHTLHLLFLPPLFHLAAHHSTVFSSLTSFCDLLLLFFLPFLFLLYASTRGALSWLTDNDRQLRAIRLVNGAVALVVVVACLEIRVVFHSFSRYLQVPAPWSYILVTVAMLGGSSAVSAYVIGLVSDEFSSVAFMTLAVLVSGASAIVIGVPIYVSLPLPGTNFV